MVASCARVGSGPAPNVASVTTAAIRVSGGAVAVSRSAPNAHASSNAMATGPSGASLRASVAGRESSKTCASAAAAQ